jgi:porin
MVNVMKQFPLIAVALLLCGVAQAQVPSAQATEPYSLATTPSLLRFPGSPFDVLRQQGVDIRGGVTGSHMGLTAGSGDKRWRTGGKADLYVTVDGEKVGLWRGFFVNYHQEWNFGRDVGEAKGGFLLPPNTLTALPRLGGALQDTAITITQNFGDALSISAGKFNLLDLASKTPIAGGGGIETFSNLGIAAPISGVTPPYLLGAIATLKTQPAIFTLMVYDPRNAQSEDVIRKPFREGTTVSLAMTVPTRFGGLPGFYGVRGVYSNKEGVDLDSLPGLAFPAETRGTLEKRGYYYASVSAQQYLWANPDKPGQGWGLFMDAGLSDGNPNVFRWHLITGVSGTGVFGRDLDRWGVGYFYYALSNDLKGGLAALGIKRRDEQGVEAYYNLALTPWLRVTANLQWIKPTNADRKDAVLAGLRTQVKF